MENIALKNYENGFNCTQAILKAYADKFEIDEDTLLKLSVGLGVGMYTGQTCGAVTAANIIFGLKYGSSEPNDKSNLRKVYKFIKTFETAFVEKNCSLNCKELKTKYNIDCNTVIKDSAKIISELV